MLRASDDTEAYLWQEFEELATSTDSKLYTMLGNRGVGARAWMAARDEERGVTMRSIFPDLLDSDLYLCGPSAWLNVVEADARACGVPEHQIHSERFDW